MPFFILFSLSIGYLAYHSNPLLGYLLLPALTSIGVVLLAISAIGVLLKKPAAINWYDLFAGSSLLVWFNYWHQFFKDESPMFLYFPFYLATVAACVWVFFIGQRHKVDAQTLAYMRAFSKTSRIQALIVMSLVIASLQMTEHYLIYPVAMTLLIFKFAFDECVKQD